LAKVVYSTVPDPLRSLQHTPGPDLLAFGSALRGFTFRPSSHHSQWHI